MFSKLRNVWWGLSVLILMLPIVAKSASHTGGFQTPPPSGGFQTPPPSGGFQTPPSSGGGFQNPLAFNSLDAFLVALLDVIITIGFPFIVLAVVYTGFLFVKAQGNDTELAAAKKTFLWVVIGALIVLGAQALSLAIKGTTDQLRGSIDSEVIVMKL